MMLIGYMNIIVDEISFEQFMVRCARAMGALEMMRDEPSDAQIPERFEPSDYHAQKIEKLNAELAKLLAMSIDDAGVEARKEFDAETNRNSEAIAQSIELRCKYESMLAKVQAWTPPTPEHEGLKRFMNEQIMESIRFDCDEDYYKGRQPNHKTGEQWLEEKIAGARFDVDYHTQQHAKEVSRTERSNEWIAALRGSIGGQ